jgi:hypothetical protein
VIRGFRVILDSDLARLYGVPTMRLNEAVKRNAERFPPDFVFQLIPDEWENLKRSQPTGLASNPMLSQIAITSDESPEFIEKTRTLESHNTATSSLTENPSQIVIGSKESGEISGNSQMNLSQSAMGSQKHRDPRFLPWAFTEHGALMAGTILRSPRAVQMSLYIVRAFVKLRQIVLENENLSRRMTEAELALRAHDEILTDLYDKLEPLLDPDPDEATPESGPKRKFGFETGPPSEAP